MGSWRHPQLWLTAVVFLHTGCIKTLGEESLHRDPLGAPERDCLIPRPVELATWSAPVSLEYPGGSLWIWNHVETTEGTRLRTVAAFVDHADEACAGDLAWHRGSDGALTPLIALTPEEEADNLARGGETRWELHATGGFVHGAVGYLYYEKILAGPGLFDALPVGSGLCLLEPGSQVCQRSEPGLIPGEPTLLFGAGLRSPNQGGYLSSDGYAYIYGCLRAAAFTDLCGLHRVRPSDAMDPSDYEVRGAFGAWVKDPAGAETLFESSGPVTAAPNPLLGEVLVVTANIWDSTLEARHAHFPWGPFQAPERLIDMVSPDSWFVDGGRLHAGLGQEGGRLLSLSYHTSAPDEDEGLHLVTFRLRGED